jgi:phage replication initiation protein
MAARTEGRDRFLSSTSASLHSGQAAASADAARSASEDGTARAASPPLVIRGKSCRQSVDPDSGEEVFLVQDERSGTWLAVSGRNATTPAYAAITDWLNFTFPFHPGGDAVETLLARFRQVLGRKFARATERLVGKFNYEHSYEVGEDLTAFFCFGGEEQRNTALLSLSGGACAVVEDWSALVTFARDELGGRITRWDGAVDDYAGVHGVEEAIRLHQEGKFTTGGHPPKMKQFGNWAAPDGTGRSVAIGIREHGKRLLVYEKGMELGCPWHPWVRWELTLGNKGRVIPWEVLLEPGRYVVGAYPNALGWVQEEMTRIRTLQKRTQISYEAAVAQAKRQFGPTLNLVLQVEGSAERAVELLRRDGVPRRVKHPAVDNPEGWIE